MPSADKNLPINAQEVLIVEDDEMLNRVMKIQVEIAGYAVRTVKSGNGALKMIDERIPSILILDLGLPDMTGQELIEKLRENPKTSSLPLIVHTALDLSVQEKSQLMLGPTRFVTKTTAYSDRLEELIIEVLN